MKSESQTMDAGCWVFSSQWFCPSSSDLNPEKGEGERGKKTVLVPKLAPDPESRETWKEKDSPSRLGDGRFKKQGTYLQGLS